jgi:hypothetical protein
MNTFLAAVALAIILTFTSQAFALPACQNGTSQRGHYGCTSFDE